MSQCYPTGFVFCVPWSVKSDTCLCRMACNLYKFIGSIQISFIQHRLYQSNTVLFQENNYYLVKRYWVYIFYFSNDEESLFMFFLSIFIFQIFFDQIPKRTWGHQTCSIWCGRFDKIFWHDVIYHIHPIKCLITLRTDLEHFWVTLVSLFV